MANLGYSYPGIAAATGTRVDGGNRHNMACKVHESMLMSWCENRKEPRNHMHTFKMKYCMHKDELALNVGQPLNDCSTLGTSAHAYPMVTTNLGDMTEVSRRVLLWLYNDSPTGYAFLRNKRLLRDVCRNGSANASSVLRMLTSRQDADATRVMCELSNMPYFQLQGVAEGIAYASTLSGDNVATVMIGGLRTVMNGGFECRAGQLLQWYFDFETPMFCGEAKENKKGEMLAVGMRVAGLINGGSAGDDGDENDDPQLKRKRLDQPAHSLDLTASNLFDKTESLKPQDEQRKKYHERALGMEDSFPKGGVSNVKHNIVYPKPYMLRPDGTEHYGDKIRVFARCVNGARKYEMMDIQLCTQSL